MKSQILEMFNNTIKAVMCNVINIRVSYQNTVAGPAIKGRMTLICFTKLMWPPDYLGCKSTCTYTKLSRACFVGDEVSIIK